MNCTIIQRRLLSAEQPDQPAEEIKSHLAQCSSCRAWQRRLVLLEQQIPQLSIPPSTAKEPFLERMKDERRSMSKSVLVHPSSFVPHPFEPGPKERALRKISLAFTLAASLLVFALAWWSWPHAPVAPPDLVRRDQARLEERLRNSLHGDTPRERLLRLAQLAEQVHDEARTLTDNNEKLDQWSRFYTRVIGEHLIVQARQLPPADRPAALADIAARLSKTESDATRLATQLQAAAPRSAASFQRIALAARQGERDLRALLNG